MKRALQFTLAALAVVSFGCNRPVEKEIVKETFIHKYGVPIPKEDWSRNGKDGQISQVMSDGVTIVRSFEKGILHGKTTYSFPNSSTVHTTEMYEHGELVASSENALSGVPYQEMTFSDGVLAQVTRWYEDGTPSAVESYESGALVNGEYRTPLNGIESRIVDGTGTRLIRGMEGELAAKDVFRSGQLHERITYFPNGDPSAVIPYEGGKIHGMRLTFLPGGLPNTVEQWVDGDQEGTTIVYQNGEKIAEVPYSKGQKNGVECRFRDGSLLVEEITWKNGVQHGIRRILADDASKTEWYHEGELVSRSTFERLNLNAAR